MATSTFYEHDLGTDSRPIDTLYVKTINYNGYPPGTGEQGEEGDVGDKGPSATTVSTPVYSFTPFAYAYSQYSNNGITTYAKPETFINIPTKSSGNWSSFGDPTRAKNTITYSFTVVIQKNGSSATAHNYPIRIKLPAGQCKFNTGVSIGRVANLTVSGNLKGMINKDDNYITLYNNQSGTYSEVVKWKDIDVNFQDATISGSVTYFKY